MSIPLNPFMAHHRTDTIWQIAAIVAGIWVVILGGWVVVREYQRGMGI